LAQKSIFELDLVRIAKWHRRCSMLAAAMILVWIIFILVKANTVEMPTAVMISVVVFLYGGIAVSIVFIVALRRAMGSNIFSLILYGILALFFNVILLLAVASSAGIIMRLAGVKAGFLGVSPDSWDKLRPGHCRGCGYSRESLEILQECPECNRVPQVI
jgi:hypothetical protein